MSGLLAIIGGTGIAFPADSQRREKISTKWGCLEIAWAEVAGKPLVFLHRHSDPEHPERQSIPPHRINYRANIAALKQIGVTGIVATSACGSVVSDWPPGTLVVLDDLLDFTTGRPRTFFDDNAVHVDFTDPYCPGLRAVLLKAATACGLAVMDGGTYVATDGPRFETRAEIGHYARIGGSVVGMTGMPEAILAREAEISYGGLSICTNAAAGILSQPLTHIEVLETMRSALPGVQTILDRAVEIYQDDPDLPSRNATAAYGRPRVW